MPSEIRIGCCRFHPELAELVDADGRPVPLRPQALRVLEALVRREGRLVSRDELFAEVWPGVVVTDDSLVQCVSELRRAIGDVQHQMLLTVPRRGYRLAVAPPIEAEAVSSEHESAPSPPSALPPPRAVRRKLPLVIAATVILLASAGAGAMWWFTRSPVERLGRPALAVLAFRNESASPADKLLGQGIAEDLIGEFARDVDVPVVSGRSSFQLDLQQLTVQQAARRLGVRYLVDGSVRRDGERVAIRTELIDGDDGRIVWTRDAVAGAAELGGLRRELVEQVSGSIRASIWRFEKQRALRRSPSSLDVYALAMRTLADKHQFTAEAYRDGRRAGEAAIRLDPHDALAWAALGYLNSVDAGNGISGERQPSQRAEALTQLDHAVQLDPELPLAHQGRAITLRALGRVPEALSAAQTAVRLAPGDADNLLFLAYTELAAGRVDDAKTTLDKALPLYPIRPVYAAAAEAEVRWATREYALALSAANDCLQRAPRYAWCRITRMLVLAESGRLDEARRDAGLVPPVVREQDSCGAYCAYAPELAARRRTVFAALDLSIAH